MNSVQTLKQPVWNWSETRVLVGITEMYRDECAAILSFWCHVITHVFLGLLFIRVSASYASDPMVLIQDVWVDCCVSLCTDEHSGSRGSVLVCR